MTQTVVRTVDGRSTALGYGALTVSFVGVGSALIFVRVSEVDPTSTLMLRMVVASMLIGAVTATQSTQVRVSEVDRRDWRLLLVSSVIFGLDLLANQWSVAFTSVANTALLMNLTPVFVLLPAWLLKRDNMSVLKLVAIPPALLGGALVATGHDGGLSVPRGEDAFGITLALTSAALYAVYLLMTKNLRKRVPTSLVMLSNSLVIAVMLAPVALLTSSPLLPRTLGGYLIIIGYAIVAQLLGHGLMAYALHTVNAGLASMSSLLCPVVAVILGWLILDEAVAAVQIVGGVILLAALAWFQIVERRAAVEG
jgi:drug/metabolite transporter (DMT)-like permease